MCVLQLFCRIFQTQKRVKNCAKISEHLFKIKNTGTFALTPEAVASISKIKYIYSAFLAIPKVGKTIVLETDTSLISIDVVY